MSAVCWPEAVAAGIRLIEVALGPEIAEEAFNIVMGMDTFEAACRRADAKAKPDEHIRQLRAMVCEAVCLVPPDADPAATTAQAPPSAVAELQETRFEALNDTDNQDRLRRCDAAAIAEINRRITKLTKVAA
jgi:hypothetical protein